MLGTSRSPAEVTVELPFTIVFEAPSQEELRDVLRMRGTWAAGLIVALAIGTAYLLAAVSRADAGQPAEAVPLMLSSRPLGATVFLDGHARGHTPAELSVEPGAHSLLLKPPDGRDGLEGQYALEVPAEGARLDAALWRRQPSLTRLRPALPGATLADVRLLDDGQLGLVIALPPGRQLQAWRLDPRTGGLESVLAEAAGPRLAFAPDGRHLASIGADVGPSREATQSSPWLNSVDRVVWLVAAGALAPDGAWRAPLEPGEHLVDASWSPRADRLLVVSSQPLGAGVVLSRLWFVDADGQPGRPPRQVLSLPSEVLPGSETWSPDGQHVAFVAHAGEINALCLLGLDASFHYLADLELSAAPLGYPRGVWSADGQRLLFVAPRQHPPGAALGWLQPDAQRALFTVDVADPIPVALQDTSVDLATWREDGQLLGLGRPGPDSPLSLRWLSASGAAVGQLLELPLKPAGAYAASLDVARARVLIATRSSSGGIDYWLAQLGLEDDA
jgi:hypothetical protein